MRTRWIGAALLLGLAAVGPARAAEPLAVGAYPANPPFEFKTADGTFDGFEIDVVKAVAARLGREVRISDLGFQAIFAAVAARRIDLAVSTIAITPARLQNQDFTQPYVDTGLVLAAGPASTVSGTADLRGRTLGAIASSTGETWIRENRERYGIGEMKTYDTQAAMLLDTLNGRLDACVNDIGGILYAIKTTKGLRIAERFPSTSRIAMMLPKGSPDTAPVNAALSALKTDGTMRTLWMKWFGSEPPEGSSTVTALPVPTP